VNLTHSLYQALQQTPDPRRAGGRRYPLAVLRCLLCLAKMAGQTTLKGVTEWVRLRADVLCSAFGLKRRTMPCQVTYKRLVDRLDGPRLGEVLAAFFTRLRSRATLWHRTQPLADGRQFSGPRKGEPLMAKQCARPAKRPIPSIN